MTIELALLAARKRHLVRVTEERHAGKTGKISELLGERFHYRGADRAIIELDGRPNYFIIVPLVHIELCAESAC